MGVEKEKLYKLEDAYLCIELMGKICVHVTVLIGELSIVIIITNKP